MPLLGSRGAASITGFGGLAKLGYLLRNSLRFRASNSAYLSRTAGTSTNQSIATWSFWFKRGTLGTAQRLFEGWTGNSDSGNAEIEIESDNTLLIGGYSTNWLQTTQVFRDPAAWYHIVYAVDTTQATSSNRIKLYVNGSQVTSFTTEAYPSQNTTFGLNNNSSALQIGRRRNNISNDSFVDGYLAEVNFVDGQALTPSSFGKTDAATGQWIPKQYSGTYGTNGFYLNFNDASAATAAAIGKDSSGNGNNWTPSGISVTAGVTYDSMTDVPTISATASNWATLNPLDKGSSINLSNGNLQYDASGSIVQFSRSTIGVTTGKWYFEVTASTLGNGNVEWGIANQTASITNYIGSDGNGWGFAPQTSGSSYKYNGGNAITYGTATGTGTYAVAFDADAGKVWFSDKTGAWIESGNPAAGTNESFSGLTGTLFASLGQYSGSSQTTQGQINFGQRPFAYSAPSGFKSLNTFNLP